MASKPTEEPAKRFTLVYALEMGKIVKFGDAGDGLSTYPNQPSSIRPQNHNLRFGQEVVF